MKIRRASDRHFRKLKKLGRLAELKFDEGAALGLKLQIAAYSANAAVREVLEVEATYTSGVE